MTRHYIYLFSGSLNALEKKQPGGDYDSDYCNFKYIVFLNKKKILQNQQADRWKKKMTDFFKAKI